MRSVLQGRKGVARRPLKSYYSNLGKGWQWLKLGWLWVVVTVMVESDQISDITGRSGCTRHMAQSITLRRHLIPIYQTHACVLLILMTIKCFYYLKNPHLVIFLRNFLFFFFFKFLNFLAALHSMWDLSSDHSLNPAPLHWKHEVLTTGLPGKFL